ncbi:hypothetical protein BDQ17DRAFT_1329888 [Cyathus striatus]|nr:hypothetical protein BDQ17DRAFT_1432215 [Cyathus striatus]KAF8996485.1 hypothetical protein BDQ17DRAFT_1329888 [Cyathus striatus]
MFSIKHTLFFLAVVAASGFIPLVASLDFTASKWIWTGDYSSGYAPPGSRAFRKTILTPPGKTARNIDIIMTANNFFALYINGVALGGRLNSNSWQVSNRFCATAQPDSNVIAVEGSNESGPAGVLAALQIIYTDGTTSTYVPDTTWKSSLTIPVGFMQPTYNDASWSFAIISGGFDAPPYNAPIPILPQAPGCSI